VAAYKVMIGRHARHALDRLDAPARKAVAQVIKSLADNPRPQGVRALKGYRPYLRVRSGDYRVIYAIDEAARKVRVVVVGHRRVVYRNLEL
jgi:mRNA interferase RelE/StbE